jgi:SlyX protein
MPVESAFERRITELETRIAFQEHALLEMSDALAASRAETARNAELLRRALDEIKPRGDFFADPASEPPPPHY